MDDKSADALRLSREAAAASDNQVLRLLTLVDGLANRGQADAVIAPLRPRLAALKPPRPVKLGRIAFMPIEPLVVAAEDWQPGSAALPRSALAPLIGIVMRAHGGLATKLSEQLAGRSQDDPALVAAVGSELWPVVAATLRKATMPADWAATAKLRETDFAPLCRAVAFLLGEAARLWDFVATPGAPDELAAARRMLATAAAAGPQELSMMLALLLARLPEAKDLLLAADATVRNGSEASRAAPDQALEFTFQGIEQLPTGTDPAALHKVAAGARLLETLSKQCHNHPTRATRLEVARQRLDGSCRAGFTATVAKLVPTKAPSDAEMAALEASVLQLLRIEAAAQQLGSGAFYTAALRETAKRFSHSTGLTKVERLRMAELLIGPDAALAMLEMA